MNTRDTAQPESDSPRDVSCPKAQEELRKAKADLEDAFEGMTKATQGLMMAHVEYGVKHGEPPPFPHSAADPKFADINKALRDHHQAMERRDHAKGRILKADRDLSGIVPK